MEAGAAVSGWPYDLFDLQNYPVKETWADA